MAVKTPDKPKVKPIDLMDASWAKTPVGYEKATARSSDDKQAALAAKEKSSPQAATATPASKPNETKAEEPIISVSPATATPQATKTATEVPPAVQKYAPLQAETTSLSKPVTIAAAPALNAAFLNAADIPAWKQFHDIEKIDPIAAETQRQREKAMTAGLIDNGFISQSIAATHALPGDTENRAKEREKDEERERERNRNLISSISLEGLQIAVRDTIVGLKSTIQEATAERDALVAERAALRADMAITQENINKTEQEITQTRSEIRTAKFNQDKFIEEYYSLHADYARKYEEDKQKFGIGDSGEVLSDPRDEVLRQKAWEENRSQIEFKYKERGLGEEFKTLEKLRNGEPVNQQELDKAVEKIKAKNLPVDLNVALLKADRNNEYFQTTSGLRVRLQENASNLEKGNYILDNSEKRLGKQLERLEGYKKHLMSQQSQEKDLTERIQRVDAYIEVKKEQLRKAEALEQKINDPEFVKAYKDGKISKEEMTATMNEFKQLQQDIRETDERFRQYREKHRQSGSDASPEQQTSKVGAASTSGGNETVPKAEYRTETTTSAGYSRTTTDSAAGLIEGSAIAQADGKLKGSFTVAAAGTPPSETPDPSVTADAALTADQQRRAAPAATFGA